MRIAIATSVEDPELPEDERLTLDALAGAGFDAAPAVWTDPTIDWQRFDAVVVRTTWDYHRTPGRFVGWLRSLEARGVVVLNAPSLIAWNLDKRYLLDFERAGIEIVPTRVLARGSNANLETLAGTLEAEALVIKPTVDASGDGAWRSDTLSSADGDLRLAEDLTRHDLLVQPLIPSIFDAGEVSMMFFGGAFSHAVRKRAAEGEFRIHEERDGRTEAAEVDDHWIAVGKRATAALEDAVVLDGPQVLARTALSRTVFARVDLVSGPNGPLLMELEVVEPELYFRFAAESPGRYAQALAHALEPARDVRSERIQART